MTDIGVWLVAWVVLAVCVGLWNQARGHSFATAFLLSMLLSPLLGAVVVVLTKRKRKSEKKKNR